MTIGNLPEASMIEKLEINHLRTLDALYKFGNISAATEYLNFVQQAISLQLKKILLVSVTRAS